MALLGDFEFSDTHLYHSAQEILRLPPTQRLFNLIKENDHIGFYLFPNGYIAPVKAKTPTFKDPLSTKDITALIKGHSPLNAFYAVLNLYDPVAFLKTISPDLRDHLYHGLVKDDWLGNEDHTDAFMAYLLEAQDPLMLRISKSST